MSAVTVAIAPKGNPKFEARNPKQFQKGQCSNKYSAAVDNGSAHPACFGILDLVL
jgi:hypothetical protein